MSVRTHVILDGLSDAQLAQQLSAAWMQQGFINAVDPAGQSAWLEPAQGEPELTEAKIDDAARTARKFAIELRDRAGSSFIAKNELAALRRQTTYEYKARFATAVMFLLPALSLHYAAPLLAGGRANDPAGLAFPWAFELIMVGWACIAAGWPLLWQGSLAVRYVRGSADLLTSFVLLGSVLPSAFGVISLLWRDAPWFGVQSWNSGPTFHAAALGVLAATFQRWQLHKHAHRLAGKGSLMIPGYSRLVGLWLLASMVLMFVAGWRVGLAFALVCPPMLSLGAINRWSPGVSIALPVVAVAVLLLAGPRAVDALADLPVIEAAAGFQILMTVVMAASWRKMDAA